MLQIFQQLTAKLQIIFYVDTYPNYILNQLTEIFFSLGDKNFSGLVPNPILFAGYARFVLNS